LLISGRYQRCYFGSPLHSWIRALRLLYSVLLNLCLLFGGLYEWCYCSSTLKCNQKPFPRDQIHQVMDCLFSGFPNSPSSERMQQCAVKPFCHSIFTFRTWKISVCVKISVRNHITSTSICKVHTLVVCVHWGTSEANLPCLVDKNIFNLCL